MFEFIAVVLFLGFAYFIYTRVKKSRGKSAGTGGPGGTRDRLNRH